MPGGWALQTYKMSSNCIVSKLPALSNAQGQGKIQTNSHASEPKLFLRQPSETNTLRSPKEIFIIYCMYHYSQAEMGWNFHAVSVSDAL